MAKTILDDPSFEFVPEASHNFPSAGLLADPPQTKAFSKDEEAAAATIPTKAVMLRLNKLTILDLFDGLPEDIFGGSNEIKLISLVFDGSSKDPFKFEVGTFPHIGKKKSLPLSDAGLALYFSEPENLPRFLDWRLLVVEDDSGTRDAGKAIQQLQGTSEYKAIVQQAISLVNPTWGVIVKITSGVISLVAKMMEQNKDDIISLYAGTYTLVFDRLGIGSHSIYHEGRSRGTYEIRVAE